MIITMLIHFTAVALRDIRRLQKSTDPVFPKASFTRLIREITHDIRQDMRWRPDALRAIQEASENWIVSTMACMFTKC